MSEPAAKEIPFKVDLAGVLAILGGSLYSRRDTALRELIQNAHDAIVRRRARDLRFTGAIRIRQDAAQGTLTVEDDGIGLTLEEAEEYLGTVGIGISGILKRDAEPGKDGTGIIGQFGVGLLSAFLLGDKVVVESKKKESATGVRWEAGAGTAIKIAPCERASEGTRVVLTLREDAKPFAQDAKLIEEAVRAYADFLPFPIYVGDAPRRTNVMSASWFEPTPDEETVTLELEQRFDEVPLDVLLVRRSTPDPIQGALYVTRHRTPGFSGRPLVTVTCRRMVISQRIDGLLPEWGSFYRGVLELPEMLPTASREDLVRDARFQRVRAALESALLERLRELAKKDAVKLQAILSWHAYTFTGAALDVPELREILAGTYRYATTQGPLTFDEIVERSRAASAPGSEAVVWFNGDRKQESWAASIFEGQEAPCVQALKTFEASLLGATLDDRKRAGESLALRAASPREESFVHEVLGLRDLKDVAPAWRDFFAPFKARVVEDSLKGPQPVLAFLNEGAELRRELDELKRRGTIPSAFARLIDRHEAGAPAEPHVVVLNVATPLVKKALAGTVHAPLASVLRLLVGTALERAGASLDEGSQERLRADIDWIAESVPNGEKKP